MTASKLAKCGIGIKTSTYFKLMYVIHGGIDSISILHTAIFSVN